MLIFGWLGGAINAIHIVPQMWKIWKTKSVEDISINSIVIKIIACSLYTIHGVIIADMPLLSMTALVLAQYVIIFFQYKYYYKVKKCDANIVESAHHTTHQITTENGDPV
tara:strand:+ start:1540 stop:1869 length:330 start_codon:yes stop_codon:yes gene_type:complete